ncbi:hypothetical protein [Aeromonas sobria]|uniref:hypothetical protein n=1 Tax=Aeromonas sobria TaxID=646 RepID=UPI001117F720|nr:hypothetical protein [Aeromonas sobria]
MSEGFSPAIRRAYIQQLTIYEISEDELKALESGSPVSLHLNFAVFLLSVAMSFFTALLTTNFPSDRIFTTFVVVLSVSFLIGMFLLILWFKEHISGSSIGTRVRNRLIPEGELIPLPVQSTTNQE